MAGKMESDLRNRKSVQKDREQGDFEELLE